MLLLPTLVSSLIVGTVLDKVIPNPTAGVIEQASKTLLKSMHQS